MLDLYCLPGKIFAHITYLWPRSGQVWASGRRHESRFAHFAYATVFWVIFVIFGLPALLGLLPMRGESPAYETPQISEASSTRAAPDSMRTRTVLPPLNGASAISSSDKGAITSDREALPPAASAPALANSPLVAADNTTPSFDPADSPAVAAAINEAFASGKNERWHEGEFNGYVVPSQQIVEGCRNVLVSVDGAPAGGIQKKICG
jgi:hypothetical protein